MRPDLLSLARLIIGEVQRFPEIGRAYQAAGPDRAAARASCAIWTARRATGQLAFDDAELAAQDFWGLILSAPRTQALVLARSIRPAGAELARYIHNGLRVFLRAYSTTRRSDLAKLEGLQSARFATGDP